MIIVYTTFKFLTLILLIHKINICKKGGVKFFYGKKFIYFNYFARTRRNKENSGSVEFQVVIFTNKIRRLTSHVELHKKDYLSQRGLRKFLGKRQQLLAYLSKKIKNVIKN